MDPGLGTRIRIHYDRADTVDRVEFVIGFLRCFFSDSLDTYIDIGNDTVSVGNGYGSCIGIRQNTTRDLICLRISVAVITGEDRVVISFESVKTVKAYTVVLRISYDL